jgi:hypothetical protein
VKTFFDPVARNELRDRVAKLTPEAHCEWGRMTPAQMLAHCTAALQVPVGELQVRKTPMGLIGWMFKGLFRNEKPFSKNAPTADEFRMRDDRDFETEMRRFQDVFAKLARGPESITCHRHPFFGKMTAEDWGQLVYKHLDHHFRQFGV